MSLKYTTATWNIIEKFFYDNPQVLVQHHISSYNEFFKTGLQSVFKQKHKLIFKKNKILRLRNINTNVNYI